MNSFERVKGVIDMHTHGYPELTFQLRNARDDDDVMIQSCIDVGMRGIVLKANTFAAIRECYYFQKQFPDFLIYPSITCNTPSGGLDPLSVEMALQLGAKAIHMPTWCARSDIQTDNFSPRLRPFMKHAASLTVENGLTVTDDETGELKPNVNDIIDLAKEYDVPLFTGHLSRPESMKIFEYANEIGYKKAIWCHPMVIPDVTPEDMEWAIGMGAHIEFIFITMLPAYQLESPQQIVELINRLGAENVILSSDNYDEYSPNTGEMNRLCVATMQHAGLTDDQIKTIMIDTPAKMLNLPLWEEILAEKNAQEE